MENAIICALKKSKLLIKSSSKISFNIIKQQNKQSKNLIFTLTTLLTLISLQGCTFRYQTSIEDLHSQALMKPKYHQVKISSFDGTKITATLYQPALTPKETAPLLIHAHGFAFFRAKRPNGMIATLIYPGQVALQAWKEGYWVLSYDQRGHGNSGGNIHLLDKDYEIKDLNYIIDWAENNIPQLKYRDQDPVIGMIGDSYGGATQLLGSFHEPRVDVIIPVTTWHDLNRALLPNEVPKTGWLTTLFTLSNTLNFGNTDKVLNQAYRVARSGKIPEGINSYLEKRSLSKLCSEDTSPFNNDVDVLLIQGFRDVLFPMEQAFDTYKCLDKEGRDIRLLGIQGGHLLLTAQFYRNLFGYHVEKFAHCGNRKLNTKRVALNFLDEKLKGKVGAADNIPKICLTHDYQSGTIFSHIPESSNIAIKFSTTEVKNGFAGFFEIPFNWLTKGVSWFTPIKARTNLKNKPGWVRPALVEIKTIEEEHILVGNPQASLNIESKNNDATLFLSLGLIKAGEFHYRIISDQVIPVKGVGKHSLRLPAISTKLDKGDRLFLVVSSYSNQYRLSGSGWFKSARISGDISLPIQTINIDNEFIVESL